MTSWVDIDFTEAIEKISTNEKKVKQKDYLPAGDFPIIDQGQQFIGGYTNDTSRVIRGQGSVIVFGDHTRIVKLVPFDFVPGADGVKVIKPRAFYHPKLFSFFLSVLVQIIPNKGYARHFQHLEAIKIPFPPYKEQEYIVEKIEEIFSDLDNAIENLKKAQGQLKIYRQAVLKYAFDGKLTEEESDWSEFRIGDIVTDSLIGLVRSLKEQNDEGVGIPYVKMDCIDLDGNVNMSKVVFVCANEEEIKKYKLQKGDVLLNTRNSYELVGKTGIVKDDSLLRILSQCFF